MKKGRGQKVHEDPDTKLALAEVFLRAAAGNYAEVTSLENTDPANRKAWRELAGAAINYVRRLDGL